MKEDVLESTAAATNDNGGQTTRQKGLEFRRYFTREGISPYDSVQWEYRTAAITGEGGEVIFEQKDVEVPRAWSMTATESTPASCRWTRARRLPRSESPTSSAPVRTAEPTATPSSTARLPRAW